MVEGGDKIPNPIRDISLTHHGDKKGMLSTSVYMQYGWSWEILCFSECNKGNGYDNALAKTLNGLGMTEAPIAVGLVN